MTNQKNKPKNKIGTYLLMGLIVLLVGIVMFFVFRPTPVPLGEEVYMREVYILLDQTNSLNEDFLRDAKNLISNHIFPYLGPGDQVFCYGVGVYAYGAPFDEAHNRILADDIVLPAAPINTTKSTNKELPANWKPRLNHLWSTSDSIKAIWLEDLNNLEPPSHDGSPICRLPNM